VSLPPTEPSPEDSSLTCDLTGSVYQPPNSSCQSSTSISSSTLSSHDSDLLSSTPAGSPKHLPPYSLSIVVTIDPQPLAPQEPTPPTLPSAPATPLPFFSPPGSHTRSHTSSQLCPAHLYLLREVAGADGIIRVYVPFSMTDFSQIEKRLVSFSNDSASCIKEFKYLT
jgi:hypothetical protein